MGHVTLVRPALVTSDTSYSSPVTPPIGLTYLAATLLENRHQVTGIDALGEKVDQFLQKDGYIFQGLSVGETVERIPSNTDIIGVSCMFTQDWPYIRWVISAIRLRFPNTPIVCGGEHITALPEFSMMDCKAIDFCALGEGENTLLELANILETGKPIEGVAGLVIRQNGKLVRTPPRNRIRNVDAIPWPAWDLFPMEVYLSNRNAHGVYRGRSMPILATRGCPYECTFCSNPLMYGNLWMARRPELVLDEIEHYINKYDTDNIDFYDLTMILRKSWILEFCDLIERRQLNFTWQLPTGTRSEVIDEQVSAALYRTGCRNVTYAPESGSWETLQKIKKKVHLPKVISSIKAAIKNGLTVKCNIIVGFPEDRRRNIFESFLFIWRLAWLGVADVVVFIFSPYPGSELFDQINEEKYQGKLDDHYFKSLVAYMDLAESTDYCKYIGPRELSFWRFIGMSSFYALSYLLRPLRLLKLITNVLKNQSNTALEQRLGAIIHQPEKIKIRREEELLAPLAAR